MAKSITKELLSGSTDGRLIKITTTATPGDTIHTANSTSRDEIYLWAVNTDTVSRILTIEFGGVAAPDDTISITMAAGDGLIVAVPGLVLTNSLVVKAFADVANKVNVGGYVERVS